MVVAEPKTPAPPKMPEPKTPAPGTKMPPSDKKPSDKKPSDKKTGITGGEKKAKEKGKKKPVKRDLLKDGEMVKSETFTWKVIRLLGSGGFGDVYKVAKVDNPDTQEYAMKTEMVEGDKRLLRLKIEVTVLSACRDQPDPERKRHFVAFEDRGVCDKFKFVVMGLVGPSLEDIRSDFLLKNYSKHTAMNAANQTLKSLSDLHFIGWIHRDIKPQNFAVGLGESEEIVYMLDFGIARQVFNTGTRTVKNPRAKVKFLGTIRFASRACHKMAEQGRKDDLETWLYMVVDLFDMDKGLPWRGAPKDSVLTLKEQFFEPSFTMKGQVPREMTVLTGYINGLRYEDEPDYAFITKALEAIARDSKIDATKKLDWLGKLKEKQKKEKEEVSSDKKQDGSDSADEEKTAGSKMKTKTGLKQSVKMTGKKAKKSTKKKKTNNRDLLKDGEMVKSETFTWKVIRLLGSGGFGDVYKVAKVDNPDTQEYAMKTEMVEGDKRLLRLKIEVTVLSACRDQPDPERKRHFVAFEDRGVCDKFKFVVMGLVGPSLEDIRSDFLLKNYSKHTAMNAAIQTLKSVSDLHFIGWIHRDIKPQNFAVGLGDSEEMIYMLDFGIARQVFNTGTRVVKNPRSKVKFLGTIRFASRACHKLAEQGRKDDLETWLYMVVDLFDMDKGLPWRGAPKDSVLTLKEQFFEPSFKMKGQVPREMTVLTGYINGLRYEDEPDYGFIVKALEAIARDSKIDVTKKLDWQGKLKEKQKKEKEEVSSDKKQDGSQEEEEKTEGTKMKTKGLKQSMKVTAKKIKKVAKSAKRSSLRIKSNRRA